jgi:hypothetical protein
MLDAMLVLAEAGSIDETPSGHASTQPLVSSSWVRLIAPSLNCDLGHAGLDEERADLDFGLSISAVTAPQKSVFSSLFWKR